MDYKNTYDYFYNKTFSIAERKIKTVLLTGVDNAKTFNTIQNNIIFEIENREKKRSNINRYVALNSLLHFYQKKLSEYQFNQIEFSLKNDVVFEYNKLHKKDLPENYTYTKFVADLGILKASNEAYRLFRNYGSLFNMMYELKDFSEFELEENNDNITLENTPLFIKLRKILYPHENRIQSAEINLINLNNKNKIESKNKIDKAEEILRFNISKFSENDKLFLLHICLNKSYNIPLSEAAKIVVITSNIDNLSIFSQETNNCVFYAKLNKGIDHYSGKPQREFIDNIILKLEPFGLININKAVQSIKTRIK